MKTIIMHATGSRIVEWHEEEYQPGAIAHSKKSHLRPVYIVGRLHPPNKKSIRIEHRKSYVNDVMNKKHCII